MLADITASCLKCFDDFPYYDMMFMYISIAKSEMANSC